MTIRAASFKRTHHPSFPALEGQFHRAHLALSEFVDRMNFVTLFNAVEAIWWIGLAVVVALVRVRPEISRVRNTLAVALVLFGISDIVELWSGAWWRPWWLAVGKILCSTIIAVAALLWFRRSRTRATSDPWP